MNRFTYYLKYAEYLIRKGAFFVSSDFKFHSKRLMKVSGRKPDIINPRSLSEKVCHRLIYDRNPFYTLLADKFMVRDYVHSRTIKIKTVPLLGVYRRACDIDFNKLPDRFVLKCNHDCGSTIICTSKDNIDIPKVRNRLSLALKKNMYITTREWQYKNIPPLILCEEYLDQFSEQSDTLNPEMLRIHCFHGIACIIEADFTDNSGKEYINVYDRAWHLLPFTMEYTNTTEEILEPKLLHRALTAAQELAKGINYCRIDLMPYRDDIYFSEITLSPRRGKLIISPPEWDRWLGEMW